MKKFGGMLAGFVCTIVLFTGGMFLAEKTKVDIYNSSGVHTFLELFFIFTFVVVIVEWITDGTPAEILLDLVITGVTCFVFVKFKENWWMSASEYRDIFDRMKDLWLPTLIIVGFAALFSNTATESIANAGSK